MRATLLKLKPLSPFHLGERGVGVEETTDLAHSDTIFSALCWTWILLHGQEDLRSLLERFANGDPPFLISSAFPYIGDLLFLPKPEAILGLSREERRRLKGVRFISPSIFERLIQGEVPEEVGPIVQVGQVWLSEEELKSLPESTVDYGLLADYLRERVRLEEAKPEGYPQRCYRLWRIAEKPQVAIDRITSASEIYYFGDVTFAEGCGPYFLVRFLNEEFREKLLAAVRLLGEEGLGGGRSRGRGKFELEEAREMELPEAEGDRFVTLSLLSPRDEDQLSSLLEGEGIAYRLITRRGWSYSPRGRPLWRKRVTMLAEGSVLAGDAHGVHGRVVKALSKGEKVPHDIYRYGYGFALGVR